MEWFAENVETIVVAISTVVALTPTQQDDGYLGRVTNLLRAVAGVFKSKKK